MCTAPVHLPHPPPWPGHSFLLTPATPPHPAQGHTVSGGLELHVDMLQEEVFDDYTISSNNGDKIAFKLEPAVRPCQIMLKIRLYTFGTLVS